MGAVVPRPAGLATTHKIVAGAVARAPIEADLALLEASRGVEDEERCDASHGCKRGALSAARVVWSAANEARLENGFVSTYRRFLGAHKGRAAAVAAKTKVVRCLLVSYGTLAIRLNACRSPLFGGVRRLNKTPSRRREILYRLLR